MSGNEELSVRIQRLEDIEEIKQLKARYCLYCDGGWPEKSGTHAGPIAELFVEDGEWDGSPGLPAAKGREAIRRLFVDCRNIPFAYHPVTNPIIEVNGDTATGNWHLIGVGDMPGGISGFFLGGYEEDYVRTPDGWRYKRMRIYQARQAAIPGGWGQAPGNESWGPDLKFETLTAAS